MPCNLFEVLPRNRQLVASWAFERGREENVVERKVIDGKTYFVVNDYEKLRGYFGELLREIQRIKSEHQLLYTNIYQNQMLQ